MGMMIQILFRIAILGAFLIGSTVYAQETRMALVIGNSDYDQLPRLRNPARDAATFSTALSNLGFTVYLGSNLTQPQLVKALAVYAEKSKTADVSLIYYAGHSAALGAQNLIFPTDFDPSNSQQLSALVKLSDVTKLMQSGAGTNIILFDACQEPLTFDTPSGQMSLSALAPQVPPIGTLISYASSPGYAAHDGTGDHSVFTGALLDNLATPDVDIETMLRSVRRDSLRNSQGIQVPQTSSSLVTDFFFYPTQPRNTSKTLQNALLENGFTQKPILSTIASGVFAPKTVPSFNAKQVILRDLLCSKIASPRPSICRN